MKITTSKKNGIDFISVEGEVDMYVALQLRKTLLDTCKRSSVAVGMDLREVPFIDSSGLAILIEGMQWSRKKGGRFMLVGVQQRVMDTLRLARLNDFFEIYPSQSDAIARLYSNIR